MVIAVAAVATTVWATGAASGSTARDLRGTWVTRGPYGAIEAIASEDLTTAVFTGRGVATNGTGYTWPLPARSPARR